MKLALRLLPLLLWVMVLGFFFAMTEIQIEGGAGWAAGLPTWRIEEHWLLDVFWGGRALTGYHAWVFSFMALIFHLPFFFLRRWSLALEARVIACIMLFWVVEDFLWFILNPAFGLERFDPSHVTWHKHWFWGAPVDYWVSSVLAAVLLCYSLRDERRSPAEG